MQNMPSLDLIRQRLLKAFRDRGYYNETPAFQTRVGYQWKAIQKRINETTPGNTMRDSTIMRIVTSDTEPGIMTVLRICYGLDIPVQEIIAPGFWEPTTHIFRGSGDECSNVQVGRSGFCPHRPEQIPRVYHSARRNPCGLVE